MFIKTYFKSIKHNLQKLRINEEITENDQLINEITENDQIINQIIDILIETIDDIQDENNIQTIQNLYESFIETYTNLITYFDTAIDNKIQTYINKIQDILIRYVYN